MPNKRKDIPITLMMDYEAGPFSISGLLISVLDNIKPTDFSNIKFYIFTSKDLDDDELMLIKSLLSSYKNSNFEIINITAYLNKMFGNQPINEMVKFFKLIIPVILSYEDWCICLDSNVVIRNIIDDLFHYKLGTNYIAGVKSLEASWENDSNMRLKEYIQLESLDNYIYTEVLLIDLAKMRKIGFTDNAIQLYNMLHLNCQDIINKLCYGHIGFIPLQYNVSEANIDFLESWYTDLYSEKELFQADQFPVIIRQIDRRPWLNTKSKASRIWWSYARAFPDQNIYDDRKQLAELQMKSCSLQNILEKARHYSEIVIFGYTNLGKSVLDYLLQGCVHAIYYFSDNNTEKQGQLYNNVKVVSAEEAISYTTEALFINVSQRFSEHIDKQLISLGILSNNIVHYKNQKNIDYYRSLAAEFYEYELEQIFFDEFNYFKESNIKTVHDVINVLKMEDNSSELKQYLMSKYWIDQWFLSYVKII